MSKCNIEGCTGRARSSQGWCGKHYERWKKHGDTSVRFPNIQKGKPCSIEGCSDEIKAKGLCNKHYARVFRHGDTDSLIPNYGRGFYIHKQGYKRTRVNGKHKLEHVIIAEKALGKPLPSKAVVHHMNENPADNDTPFNLVICPNQAYHFLLHKRMNYLKKYGFLPEHNPYLPKP